MQLVAHQQQLRPDGIEHQSDACIVQLLSIKQPAKLLANGAAFLLLEPRRGHAIQHLHVCAGQVRFPKPKRTAVVAKDHLDEEFTSGGLHRIPRYEFLEHRFDLLGLLKESEQRRIAHLRGGIIEISHQLRNVLLVDGAGENHLNPKPALVRLDGAGPQERFQDRPGLLANLRELLHRCLTDLIRRMLQISHQARDHVLVDRRRLVPSGRSYRDLERDNCGQQDRLHGRPPTRAGRAAPRAQAYPTWPSLARPTSTATLPAGCCETRHARRGPARRYSRDATGRAGSGARSSWSR